MTPKAKEFTEHNKAVAIVSGECLPRYVPPNEIEKTLYRFEDGSQRTITVADARSTPGNWLPRWKHI